MKNVVQWIIADASSKESKKWGFDDWKSYQEGENPKVNNKYRPVFDRIPHIKLYIYEEKIKKIGKCTNTSLSFKISPKECNRVISNKTKNKDMKKNDIVCRSKIDKLLRIMRLTVFILAISTLSVLASKTYSQSKVLNIDVENKSVKEILINIEKQSEFYFMYSDKFIDVARKVSVKITNKKIDEVLSIVFAGTDVIYSFRDQLILLTTAKVSGKDPQLNLQQNFITGKVIDTQGLPLPGVNVYEKQDPTHGVITLVDGTYSIKTDNSDAILVFSFIGFNNQEIPINGNKVLNVTMIESFITLDEVVSIGYGIQKKVSVTGAVSSIKADEMEQIPATNLSNMLAGRVSGVNIKSVSSFVGATSTIEIRGKGSWNAEPPLFVIDNVIVDKETFDALEPSEVESISFLKDAATASIYGARSAGGVVLVSTKTGGNKKVQFNLKSSYSFQTPTRPLQTWTPIEELYYRNDRAETFGLPKLFGPDAFEYFKDQKAYDINDYIWNKPVSQNYNLSVNGGNEDISYFLMIGANSSDGAYIRNGYDRYNFRSNISAKLSDYIDIKLNLSGYQSNFDRFYNKSWADNLDKMAWIVDYGLYRNTLWSSKLFPFAVDDNGVPTYDINANQISYSYMNPLSSVTNKSYTRSVTQDLQGTFNMTFKIPGVEGLSTSVLVNYHTNVRRNKDLALDAHYYKMQFRDLPDDSESTYPYEFYFDPTKTELVSVGQFEYVGANARFTPSYQFNWFVDYSKIFGEHSVSAKFIYEQSAGSGVFFAGRGEELIYSSSIDQLFNTNADPLRRHFDGYESEWGRESYIGRLHYEYSSRYIAEFSFREDASYKFAPENRWGFFPSGSFGWRISEESFFSSNTVSNLKLRLSAGTTGNDAIKPFQYVDKFVPGRSTMFGSTFVTGLKSGDPPMYNVTWEKASVYNVGLDFGIFNDKISGEVDAFYRYSWDILGSKGGALPKSYGAKITEENFGVMDVKGVDFSIQYKNRFGAVDFNVGVNMGYAKDRVLQNYTPENRPAFRDVIGRPLTRIFGFRTEGLIRDQATLDKLLADGFTQFGEDPMLGAILHTDIRGDNYSEGPDGKIDFNDLDLLSENGKPRINYGLHSGVSWKGISANVLIQGVARYDRMLSSTNSHKITEGSAFPVKGGILQYADTPFFEIWAKDHWSTRNPDAKYPRAHNTTYSPQFNQFGWAPSQFWMRNGAYIRLRNLNIAYSLPTRWISKIGLDKFQVYFNGENLFEISGIPEYDPEQANLDSYPIMKTFAFGINVTF